MGSEEITGNRKIKRYRGGITAQVLVLVLVIIMVGVGVLSGTNYLSAVASKKEQIENQMTATLETITAKVEQILGDNIAVSTTLARLAESSYRDFGRDDFKRILERYPLACETTVGAGVWFEPDAFEVGTQYYGPYAYKDGGSVVYTDEYSDPSYDYLSSQWYTMAMDTDKPYVMSDPYFDPVANITMITSSAPFYNEDGKFIGLTTADMDLTALQTSVSELKVMKTGKVSLLSADGTFIVSTNLDNVMKVKISEDSNTQLAEIGKKMLVDESGIGQFTENGKDYNLYFRKLPISGLIAYIAIEHSEIYSDISKLLLDAITHSLIMLILTVIILVMFMKKTFAPLKVFVAQLGVISSGDLTKAMDARLLTKGDEIGDCARAVELLRESIGNLVRGIVGKSKALVASSEDLTSSTSQASTAVEAVNRAIAEIAEGSSSQARDTEDTANNVGELGNLIEDDLVIIQNLNVVAEKIEEQKDGGFSILKGLVDATQRSGVAEAEVFKLIMENGTSVDKVEVASSMIHSIAGQTNLLALNAAIEAARAGEQGKGFAVVAGEIKKLAEQSSSFTSDIDVVIKELKEKSKNAVTLMQQKRSIVKEQEVAVNDTDAKFKGIALAIGEVKEIVTKLNGSASNMSINKNNIVELVQNLSAVSEENAAGTQEASALMQAQTDTLSGIAIAGGALEDVAKELDALVEKFKIE